MTRWQDALAAAGRTAMVRFPDSVRRAGRLLRGQAGRASRHLHRASLGTCLRLVLVSVAAASAFVTVLLQDGALAADLRAAARSALTRSATLAGRLVELHLAARADRYRTIAATPQFEANFGARHGPTLAHYAGELAAAHGAKAILFLDREQGELAGFGDEALRAHVLERFRAGGLGSAAAAAPQLLARADEVFAVAQVPIVEGGEPRGRLVVLEAIVAADLAAWSEVCGGQLSIARAGADDGASVGVRAFDDLQLRVGDAFPAEQDALANSRANLVTGGLIGVALASIASMFLARRLLRPIRTIQVATERIGRGDLAFRLAEDTTDEVGDVARAFNVMLDRLERSIDERVRAEQQIHHLACHDGLTGLGNRRMLKGQLAAAIERAREQEAILGVFHLGLDRFKGVNETLGHTLGDELLVEVARRLERWLGEAQGKDEQTLIARLAGDEFTVLLPSVADRRQVEALAGKLLEVMAVPFELGGQSLAISASLGIALSPDDAEDPEALLRGSDLALTEAKSSGGSGYAFFADSMQELAARRLALDHQLRQALGNDEFELHYQPKLDLRSGQLQSVEALLRWRNSVHGLVGPDEFIPLAEETGAIVPIGDWVLLTAMRQALAWQQAGLPPVRVAVNVSGRQLQQGDEFVARVAQLLAETGLDPELLELEITESFLLDGTDTAVALLHTLKQMGVGLALDDFGTGYSSLSQLRNLPIDTLKVDRSFLQGVDSNPESAGLIGAIIGMAKMLDLRVVVEGVETHKQRRLLAELGCDEIQGYLVHRPMPAEEATAALRRKRVVRAPRKPAKQAAVKKPRRSGVRA